MQTRLLAAAATLSSAVLFITTPSIFADHGHGGGGNQGYSVGMSLYSGISANYSGATRNQRNVSFWDLDLMGKLNPHYETSTRKRSVETGQTSVEKDRRVMTADYSLGQAKKTKVASTD